MPYLQLRPDSTLGDFGCSCKPGREKGKDEALGGSNPSARPAGPVFEVECPAGCPPVAAGQCRAIVRQAILAAIRLANNAADRVEAATRFAPGLRDPEAAETARLFRFFFGHDPTRPVTWAGNAASGASVALRFRRVAQELDGGRRMVFRCSCPGADAETRARTNQAVEPNTVNLCTRFWNPPPGLKGLPPPYFRAGIILHEMFHVLYHEFFHHPGHPSGDIERRRDNAHCYEAFALRAAGFGADPSDVTQCKANLAGYLDGLDGLGQTTIKKSRHERTIWSQCTPGSDPRVRRCEFTLRVKFRHSFGEFRKEVERAFRRWMTGPRAQLLIEKQEGSLKSLHKGWIDAKNFKIPENAPTDVIGVFIYRGPDGPRQEWRIVDALMDALLFPDWKTYYLPRTTP